MIWKIGNPSNTSASAVISEPVIQNTDENNSDLDFGLHFDENDDIEPVDTVGILRETNAFKSATAEGERMIQESVDSSIDDPPSEIPKSIGNIASKRQKKKLEKGTKKTRVPKSKKGKISLDTSLSSEGELKPLVETGTTKKQKRKRKPKRLDNSFECEHCGRALLSWLSLQSHIATYHKGKYHQFSFVPLLILYSTSHN